MYYCTSLPFPVERLYIYRCHRSIYAKVNARKAIPPTFHVGGKVRIVGKKGTFEKGFTPNWTEECVYHYNSESY